MSVIYLKNENQKNEYQGKSIMGNIIKETLKWLLLMGLSLVVYYFVLPV
jgi:hypothetical protein